jgi:flagellar basal-body rod protein FlgG
VVIPLNERPTVLQGFIEASNVDPVIEMVQMIEVNRAYEANQKMIQAADTALGVLISQVAKFG